MFYSGFPRPILPIQNVIYKGKICRGNPYLKGLYNRDFKWPSMQRWQCLSHNDNSLKALSDQVCTFVPLKFKLFIFVCGFLRKWLIAHLLFIRSNTISNTFRVRKTTVSSLFWPDLSFRGVRCKSDIARSLHGGSLEIYAYSPFL